MPCLQLKAYEEAKTSADNAYSKSKALALQRLNSRNSQLLRGSTGGAPGASPPAGSAAVGSAPLTPEQAEDRTTFSDDGEHGLVLLRSVFVHGHPFFVC